MNKAQTWDYSPAPESTDHIQLKDQYDLFINGEFVPSATGKYFDSINPANEENSMFSKKWRKRRIISRTFSNLIKQTNQ